MQSSAQYRYQQDGLEQQQSPNNRFSFSTNKQEDPLKRSVQGEQISIHEGRSDHLGVRQSISVAGTFNEVQSMLKGIFANLNINMPPTQNDSMIGAHFEGGSALSGMSPTRPSDLDMILASKQQDEKYDKARQNIFEIKQLSPVMPRQFQSEDVKEMLEQQNARKDMIETLREQNNVLREQLRDLNQQLDLLSRSLKEHSMIRKREIENNKCNHEQQIKQLDGMLKTRDKEYHSLLVIQQSQNASKEKEVQGLYLSLKSLRQQIEKAKQRQQNSNQIIAGYDKFYELDSKLKDTDRKYADLKIEVASLHRIQNEQSKAIHEIGSTKNYPGKIRDLLGEIRDIKENNKLLEEKVRHYEETRKKTYNEVLAQEDKCNQLKTKIAAYQGSAEDNQKLKQQVNNTGLDEGKMNLIRKVQILEKQILDKERQNKQLSLKLKQANSEQTRMPGIQEYDDTFITQGGEY